jgi:hypothetical protein
MIPLKVGSAAESLQNKDVIAHCGDHGPMSQQDIVCSHGNEMYPQKFVRLVGCHDSRKHEVASRLH